MPGGDSDSIDFAWSSSLAHQSSLGGGRIDAAFLTEPGSYEDFEYSPAVDFSTFSAPAPSDPVSRPFSPFHAGPFPPLPGFPSPTALGSRTRTPFPPAAHPVPAPPAPEPAPLFDSTETALFSSFLTTLDVDPNFLFNPVLPPGMPSPPSAATPYTERERRERDSLGREVGGMSLCGGASASASAGSSAAGSTPSSTGRSAATTTGFAPPRAHQLPPATLTAGPPAPPPTTLMAGPPPAQLTAGPPPPPLSLRAASPPRAALDDEETYDDENDADAAEAEAARDSDPDFELAGAGGGAGGGARGTRRKARGGAAGRGKRPRVALAREVQTPQGDVEMAGPEEEGAAALPPGRGRPRRGAAARGGRRGAGARQSLSRVPPLEEDAPPEGAAAAAPDGESASPPPGGGPRTAPLSESQKRSNHILSEQKRRNAIRVGFKDLVGLLVAGEDASGIVLGGGGGAGDEDDEGAGGAKKRKGKGSGRGRGRRGDVSTNASKSVVLTQAASYILWLERGNAALEHEVARVEGLLRDARVDE